MGVYKLSFPDEFPKAESRNPKSTTGIRGAATTFMGRRFNIKVQPTLRSFLEVPELEHFTMGGSTDPTISSSSPEDDSSSLFTASTRTSNTLSSDDDAALRELSLRTSGDVRDVAPARHSTACCTDVALRRELRKKFQISEPASDAARDCRNSFAMGGNSFRRELEMEDRVESLALWEETEIANSTRDRVVRKEIYNPHSWPLQHQTATHSSGTSGRLLFRKPKKGTSFFNGFFSGLSFSTSRRSKKV